MHNLFCFLFSCGFVKDITCSCCHGLISLIQVAYSKDMILDLPCASCLCQHKLRGTVKLVFPWISNGPLALCWYLFGMCVPRQVEIHPLGWAVLLLEFSGRECNNVIKPKHPLQARAHEGNANVEHTSSTSNFGSHSLGLCCENELFLHEAKTPFAQGMWKGVQELMIILRSHTDMTCFNDWSHWTCNTRSICIHSNHTGQCVRHTLVSVKSYPNTSTL